MQLSKSSSSFMGANAEVDAARGDANTIKEEDYVDQDASAFIARTPHPDSLQ